MFARSRNLILRRLHPDDFDAFVAYRGDSDVAQYQSWPKMSEEETKGFLYAMSRIETAFRRGEWTQIAVAAADDSLMGDMGIHVSESGEQVELGITIARRFQGHGHASTAMRLALEMAFGEPSVHHVICGADTRNAPSLALIAKLGFEWTHREDAGDGATDEMFAMTRQDWTRLQTGDTTTIG